jgi:hypothetical protein
MTQQEQKKTSIQWGQLTGLFVVLFISSQCVAPFHNSLSRFIADNAVYVMLSFFVVGMLAFLLHRPYVMLYTWLACAGLCHFLKGAETNQFYYSKAVADEKQIHIAHFDFKKEDNISTLLNTVSESKADILSLQANIKLKDSFMMQMQANYPYSTSIDYDAEDKRSCYIFSKYKLDATDTFYHNGIPHLSGSFCINNFEDIHFLSLHLADKTPQVPDTLGLYLEAIADYFMDKEAMDLPGIVFGDIPSNAWTPELRAFRNRCVLNDSRLDLELKQNEKHIFYSAHLSCLQFEQGIHGVSGVYQLKAQEQRPVLGQRVKVKNASIPLSHVE